MIQHSKNLMCYDKVDVKGLTPYDYARYLRELKPNEKWFMRKSCRIDG